MGDSDSEIEINCKQLSFLANMELESLKQGLLE